MQTAVNTNYNGCVMLNFNFPEMLDLQTLILSQHLYTGGEDDRFTYGLEADPHCTLLYGLEDSITVGEVEELLSQFEFDIYTIRSLSLFENKKFDVLKFDIDEKVLFECNTVLKTLPHCSTFPVYSPHITVGYLKPGFGEKYLDVVASIYSDVSYELLAIPTHITYSVESKAPSTIKIQRSFQM